MGRSRSYKTIDGKRGVIRGRFYIDKTIKKFDVCTYDDYYFKNTKRGKVKRTKEESHSYFMKLYNQKLHEIQDEQQKTEEKTQQGMLIQDAFNIWIEHIRQNRSQRTVDEYQRNGNTYIRVNGNYSLREHKAHYEVCFKKELNRRGLSEATQHKMIRSVQGFLN